MSRSAGEESVFPSDRLPHAARAPRRARARREQRLRSRRRSRRHAVRREPAARSLEERSPRRRARRRALSLLPPLRAEPLAEVDEWIGRYRAYIERKLDGPRPCARCHARRAEETRSQSKKETTIIMDTTTTFQTTSMSDIRIVRDYPHPPREGLARIDRSRADRALGDAPGRLFARRRHAFQVRREAAARLAWIRRMARCSKRASRRCFAIRGSVTRTKSRCTSRSRSSRTLAARGLPSSILVSRAPAGSSSRS